METDSFHEYRQLSLLPKWGEELITLHLHSKAALLGLHIALLVSFKDDSVGPPPSSGQVQEMTGVRALSPLVSRHHLFWPVPQLVLAK